MKTEPESKTYSLGGRMYVPVFSWIWKIFLKGRTSSSEFPVGKNEKKIRRYRNKKRQIRTYVH